VGPNEGKSFLEQTTCVARALMCYRATMFDDPSTLPQKYDEYSAQHGSLEGKWIKCEHSWGDWYVYHESDTLAHGGKSQRELPQDAKITAVFDFRSTNRVLVNKFSEAISMLEIGCERGSDIFLGTALERFSDAEPSPVIEDFAETFGDLARVKIQNLRRSVAACDPDFNNGKIEEFRSWLRKLPDTRIPRKPNLLAVGDPNHLSFFLERLAKERSKYCVDAGLFGSVRTITDICVYCASKVQEKLQGPVFNNLALVLTSSTETDPIKILADTVRRAIEGGFINELLEIVNKYREIMDGKIESARNSESVDKSLDLFYEAIPFAHGVLIILATIPSTGHFDGDRARWVEASKHIVDEQLVKMIYAFAHQIRDFNGSEWNKWRHAISVARKKSGAEAATKLVDFVVSQNLFYPRSFIPALLGENETM
jgi:hypothetical protein